MAKRSKTKTVARKPARKTPKARTKASTTRVGASKSAKKAPPDPAAGVPLHSIAKFVRRLIDDNEYETFVRELEKSGAVARVERSDLRFAMSFSSHVRNLQSLSPKASGGYDDPCPGQDPFDCKKNR